MEPLIAFLFFPEPAVKARLSCPIGGSNVNRWLFISVGLSPVHDLIQIQVPDFRLSKFKVQVKNVSKF